MYGKKEHPTSVLINLYSEQKMLETLQTYLHEFGGWQCVLSLFVL
jgi:hypothetical protein